MKKIVKIIPRVVQIVADGYRLYALDENGGIWMMMIGSMDNAWYRLPGLPEGDK